MSYEPSLSDIIVQHGDDDFMEQIDKQRSEASRDHIDVSELLGAAGDSLKHTLGSFGLVVDDAKFCWHAIHMKLYQDAGGIPWPPTYAPDFLKTMLQLGATDREAEIIWLEDIISPMSESFAEECILDVSQNGHRLPKSTSGTF